MTTLMGCNCGKKKPKPQPQPATPASARTATFALQTTTGVQRFGSRLEAEAARVRQGGSGVIRAV